MPADRVRAAAWSTAIIKRVRVGESLAAIARKTVATHEPGPGPLPPPGPAAGGGRYLIVTPSEILARQAGRV